MKSALFAAGLLLLAPGAAVAAAQDDAAPAAPVINAHYTLDTPIKILVADPNAKAVLDKDLPGLSSDDNLPKFEDKSLRQLQPMTGGQLTDALLEKTGSDLAAIGGDAPAVAPAVPTASGSDSPRTADQTGR
ncbi:MAG: hypothetical protein ACTHMG_10320 [Sphingomonas sp.]